MKDCVNKPVFILSEKNLYLFYQNRREPTFLFEHHRSKWTGVRDVEFTVLTHVSPLVCASHPLSSRQKWKLFGCVLRLY